MVKVKKDLTGMRFGRLVVIKQSEEDYIDPKGNHLARWECECDCGNICNPTGHNLKCGLTTSCGCYNKELISQKIKEKNKRQNTYDMTSFDYGVGYTTKGEPFWFDKEDYDKIKKYCWRYDSHGYVESNYRDENNKKKVIRLHRLVMNVTDKKIIVDHIEHAKRNEYKIDNRKQNLRVVTDSQNCMNRHVQSNNTSGITGVSWSKKHQKWFAYIGYQGKLIHLGSSSNKQDCIKWRKEAEEKYFGEYSLNNFQKTLKEEKGA